MDNVNKPVTKQQLETKEVDLTEMFFPKPNPRMESYCRMAEIKCLLYAYEHELVVNDLAHRMALRQEYSNLFHEMKAQGWA